jgi:hypothetical protein
MKFPVRPSQSKNSLCAFSLVETTIVLALLGLILSGIWGLIRQGWEVSHQELAIGEVITIVNNIRGYYSSQAGVGSGVNTKTLYNAGVYPKGMQMGTYCPPLVCVDLPWGPQTTAGSVSATFGTIFIKGWPAGTLGTDCASAPAPPPNSFSPYFCVELIVKSQSTCLNLVSSLVAPTGPTGLKAVYINPTALSASPTPIRPFNASAVSTNCAIGTSDPARYPKQSEITLVYTLTNSP